METTVVEKPVVMPPVSKKYEKNIFILNLRDPSFCLKSPIPILLEYDDETYVAVSYDLNLFGYADNEQEAITDLCHEIIDYYLDLKSDYQATSKEMKNHWQFLQMVVTECN